MATMSGPIPFITGLCTRYVTYVSSEALVLTPPSHGSNDVGLSMADETGHDHDQVGVFPVVSSPFAHPH